VTRPALFDPGLQPERTRLAWRRTLLTLTVATLIALRVLPPVLGTWTLGVGVAGLLATTALWLLAGRRARQVQAALVRLQGRMPDGGLLLGLTLVVGSGAVLGLLVVVASLSGP
jgi:4-amino-4-deoxy-L-arabinose transferase-like glycosyltransferase